MGEVTGSSPVWSTANFENLAVDFSDSEDIQRAWMNSEKHRENVLNKDFIEVGIGIAQGLLNGRNTIFVVQEFGTPMGNDKDISVDFKDSKSFESQVVDLDLAEVQVNILEVTKLFCSSIGDMFSSPLCL